MECVPALVITEAGGTQPLPAEHQFRDSDL